jgi:hypothetical protein
MYEFLARCKNLAPLFLPICLTYARIIKLGIANITAVLTKSDIPSPEEIMFGIKSDTSPNS